MMLLHPVLILSFISGGLTKVVTDFQKACGQFFANGNSPTILFGPQYKQICQSFKGQFHYATLYDTENKIPVYSAYKFERNRCPRKEKKWCIEPQLDDETKGQNMALESEGQYGCNQALKSDYKNSGYHRGHLAPVCHANSEEFVAATFTLTNAAPQQCSFNQGQWRKTEKKVAEILTSECPAPYKAYIVTGAVPGDRKINGRVTVPRVFWTAYCCIDKSGQCKSWRGFIGDNCNFPLVNMTLGQIEEELTHQYRMPFKLFNKH